MADQFNSGFLSASESPLFMERLCETEGFFDFDATDNNAITDAIYPTVYRHGNYDQPYIYSKDSLEDILQTNTYEDRDDISDEDDGLYAMDIPDAIVDDDNDEEYGDDNDIPASGDGVASWKVEHSTGDHKLKPKDFIAKTASPSFDGPQALEMLQRLYTMDYGSRRTGSKAADIADEYHPLFFLDYISIVGRPLKPITRASERFFDNITVTFKDWQQPYTGKHQYKLPFDITNRTFRLAAAATRETWYIVMHPIMGTVTELLSSRQERLRRQAASSRLSALKVHHAQALASYITKVFVTGGFMGERVEPSWTLNSPLSQKLTCNTWTRFQERFVEDWPLHVEKHAHDSFWVENQPVFHAYDYGANIEIEVSHQVQTLGKEARLRTDDDPAVDSEDDSESGSEMLATSTDFRSGSEALADGDRLIDPNPTQGETDGLYSEGLNQLQGELKDKYDLENISHISYALAVDLHCVDSRSTDVEQKAAYCMLADRNLVRREYSATTRVSGLTFYPLAFHPAYGNFTSAGPPKFLKDHVLAVMKDNMSFQNDGADILSCDYFQAYSSGVKRSIRYNPEDLLATQGIATAALSLPATEASRSSRIKAKQQRLLGRLRGQSTPDEPDASKPFARERVRIQQAIDAEEFAYRMEQVVAIDVGRLVLGQRNLRTVLRPIFQLMRFYLQEPEHYIHLLRCFRPKIFPCILGSFARVFELAMDEMLLRFQAQGSKGLGVALSEGVAALDRLGHYCFTGSSKVLMSSVLTPLKTMASLQRGAWPFIDPRVLDLRYGEGTMDFLRWPRSQDGRPAFMHPAALAFQYGPEIAARRHSLLWFRDLGGKLVAGPVGATRFLEDVFRDLWVPQMAAFISHQIRRSIHRSQGADMGVSAAQLVLVEEWVQSEHPFTWRNFEPIWALTHPTASMVTTKSRQDFSLELYESCVGDKGKRQRALSSLHCTWFAVLQAAFTFTKTERVTKEQWLGGLAAAMLSNQIEFMPGSHGARITYTRVVRLVGHTPTVRTFSARPGSLKREALEAESNAARPTKRQAIDLGCDIPFKHVPNIIQEGFKMQERVLVKGDQKILAHFHVARNCLEQCLGDPLCDLLIMLVVTFSASSATPFVASKSRHFEAGPRKEPGLFAASLATRMLWFLRPRAFPWAKDDGMVLRISEMTKKFEHKGVNNRLLREMGWVKVAGSRDNPRNSDLQLQSEEKLLELRRDLLRLRRDPAGFIGRVFRSEDMVWVERCSGIISDRNEDNRGRK